MKTNTPRIKISRIFLLLLISALYAGYATAQLRVDYGKSYVNLTKGAVGGTIEPGDILQVRATFVVIGSAPGDYADSCGYYDVIPANTTYVPGSLGVLTNEGKIYKTFTDAQGDDEGYINGSSVRIYLGYNNFPATAFRRGRISYDDKPSFYGSTCIMIATFRVKVTGGYGSTVSLGGGIVTYKPPSLGVIATVVFPSDNVMVFQNLPICPNSSNNTITSEFAGTFGSGNIKNRAASNKISNNYIYNTFGPNSPNDYYYNISNNTSIGGSGYTTSDAWPIPNSAHRVFGLWDIIGDHTGAANPLMGNPATDTVTGSGGYMAVINSSYKTGIAFLDTITDLCPNTYYQYSAWFRNICSRCACDSNGKGPGSAGYIPTGPGDSSGVRPNLTFNVNGYDYYTTGDLPYTGQWIQKGFTYLTGPTQTSMIIFVRNNAPGGGGNDWAIDDIGVASCAPNISLTPNKADTLCRGSDDTVRFKVAAFFPNYTEWRLEQSVDNGSTWTLPGLDTLGNAPTGSSAPVYNSVSGQYEYVVTRYYQLNYVDTTVVYRLVIASTAANLSSMDCNFITSNPKFVRTANCLITLPTQLSIRGSLQDGAMARIQWTSKQETGNISYVLERSDNDGATYRSLKTLPGTASSGMGASYIYDDPEPVAGKAYYRVRIVDELYHNYSQVVLLSNNEIAFGISGLINPFSHLISFNLTMPEDYTVQIALYDSYGRSVLTTSQGVTKGVNHVVFSEPDALQTGMYVLRIQYRDQLLTKQIIKKIK